MSENPGTDRRCRQTFIAQRSRAPFCAFVLRACDDLGEAKEKASWGRPSGDGPPNEETCLEPDNPG